MFAFVLKTVMALSTYGSTDVLLFEAAVAKIREDDGAALYRDGVRTEWCGQTGQRACPPFNHPPFIINALRAWAALGNASGLPMRFWLRFTSAVADVGSLALMMRMTIGWQTGFPTRIALLLLAASPVAILISGFHGNTDPIMVFLVLLSVFLIQTKRPAWLAGVALGLAASIKVVPFVFAPVLLLSIPGMQRKLEFSASAGLAFVALSSPLLFRAPDLVASRVFWYSPQSGVWGLSLLALASRGDATSA